MKSLADGLLRFGAILAAVIALAAQYAWGDVVSDRDGRFSVDFPGKASESIETVPTKAGTAKVHVFSVKGAGRTTYTALYSDYPAGSIGRSPADAIYEGAINGAVSQAGGTVESKTKITNSGIAGREAIFDSPDKAEAMRVRYFLVGDRLYQVAYHGPRGSEDGKNATEFLDSFKIVR